MNKFIQKLKNSNKVYLSILIITLIAYIIGYTIFVKNIAVLTGIETLVRMILIILFGIWFLVWLIMGLVYVINKKYSSFIIMIIFTLLFNGIFFVAGYYIDTIYKEIDNYSYSYRSIERQKNNLENEIEYLQYKNEKLENENRTLKNKIKNNIKEGTLKDSFNYG